MNSQGPQSGLRTAPSPGGEAGARSSVSGVTPPRQDRAWNRLAEVLGRGRSREQTCEAVCRVVVEEFGFTRALIATLDGPGGRLVTRASHDPGISAHVMRALRRLFTIPLAPQPDGRHRVAAWCVLREEQVHVADASAYSFRPGETVQTDALIKVFATKEYVLTPIPGLGGAIGLLAVDKKGRPGRIHEADLGRLRSVARLTGLALETGRMPRPVPGRRTRPPAERPPADRTDRPGQMQAVLDALRQGLVVLDEDDVIRYLNRAAASLLDSLPWDAVGEPWRRVLPLADPDGFARFLSGQPRLVSSHARKWTLASPVKGEVVVEVDVLPIPSVHGGEGRALFLQDVTDRAEEERVRDEFVSMLVHDLSAPLQSVLGFAELLLMERAGPLEETQRDFVSRIVASGELMARLVHDILRLADLESGRALLESETVDPSSLVEGVLDRLDCLAAASSVALSNEIPVPLPRIRGDGVRLTEALQNIVANAIEASEPGGAVRVRAEHEARPPGGRVRLQVIDEGVGLTDEEVEHLFDKYRSLQRRERRKAGAHGLGLAIARLVVEAHGGRIDVSSSPGRGTTVTIDLPADLPADPPAEGAR